MPTTHSSTPVAAVRLHDQTHGASLEAGLTRLWRDGQSCDITIRVPAALEDGAAATADATGAVVEVEAHRIVLAAVSAPLDRMIFGPMASVDEENVLTLADGIEPAALQHGQNAPARLLRLHRARLAALGGSAHPGQEAGPLGAQPLPRVLELAASKAADFPWPLTIAFDHLKREFHGL